MTTNTNNPRSRQLTTPKIVFLIVAAAAPIGAMTGLTPLQYALGNGAGTPAAYVIAGAVLLCFGVGYAAMARQITNTGGFYTFIVRGLGRLAGVPGSFVALIAYTATCLQVAAALGYFCSLTINPLVGVGVPWYAWSLTAVALATTLSYRSVDLSAKVVGLLMVAEIGVLLIVDFAVIGTKGIASALPLESFAPSTAFTPGLAVAMLFAFSTFVGFESAALYGEEAKDPTRSIPRAIYVSLTLITVFYAFTSWVGVGAAGVDNVRDVASQDLGDYWLNVSSEYVGVVFTQVLGILLCTSLFAALLALQNAGARYLFSLGRERVLPGWLGAVHERFGSPSRASLILGAICVIVPGAFYVTGLDPYTSLMSSMTGLSVLGILTLQAAAAASIISYFHIRKNPDAHWLKTLVAPLLGLVGFIVAEILAIANFTLITGTSSMAVNALPLLIPLAVIGGVGYALWLRKNRPEVYDLLANEAYVRSETESVVVTPVVVNEKGLTQ